MRRSESQEICDGRRGAHGKTGIRRDRNMVQIIPTAVIGAGASGCMAAVSASRSGEQVLLFDANDRIGRKIYATGNGRGNLTNLHMDRNCYHAGGGADLSAFFARFSASDNIRFWESEGIFLHDRNGYVYPRTDQAATIAEAFEKILKRQRVKILPGTRVTSITSCRADGGKAFRIETERGEQYFAGKIILAGGGAAGPQYGCRGDMYRFAESFGHSVKKPLPALVQLFTSEPSVRAAAGVRCDARIRIVSGGKELAAERGELQITEKGISGIPVFQVSAPAVRAADAGRSVHAEIDFLPGFSDEAWQREKDRRLSEDRYCMLSVFFLGLVNKKVLDMVLRTRGLQAEKKASKVGDRDLLGIMEQLRACRLPVTGSGSFGQAQVTSGGVPLRELDEDLQSRLVPGLYMAGEMLDVDGICGGYNLQWAMTSGWIAGQSAACKKREG